ncbi:6-phosphogluconolactonase [Terriglobus roseus]|uniref:Glucosamine-6-phosphate deaminase n=1 Tax=Terriglobus roseus TaxID=392734 RepID=A0A1G7H6F1_9BACT|nr:6-phosphogluconolactonase [Terriglobus roseus]SDE96017.1 glucosamine-6-phosphate deaminase [Terriglobus roseus]
MTIATSTFSCNIHVLTNPKELGELAASDVAKELRALLAVQPKVRMIFAAAPSQSEMLHALASETNIEWSRVDAFHMDEYVGLPLGAKQRFGEWLKREFFDHVPLGGVHLIEPGDGPEFVAKEYAALLAESPIDIVCLGIGMNGHIAFNDPPADFEEPNDVRVVELEQMSRVQQVEEGLFPTLEDVPKFAVTLSIPRLLRARKLFCCVPGALKTAAVTRAFTGPIDTSSPASILREHTGCTLYLDVQSAAGLLKKD